MRPWKSKPQPFDFELFCRSFFRKLISVIYLFIYFFILSQWSLWDNRMGTAHSWNITAIGCIVSSDMLETISFRCIKRNILMWNMHQCCCGYEKQALRINDGFVILLIACVRWNLSSEMWFRLMIFKRDK